MAQAKRSYSDPSFGSKKVIASPATGSLAGTVAMTTTRGIHTWMYPVTVQDVSVVLVAGASGSTQSFVLAKSLGGTGSVTAFSTIAVGTAAQAANTVKDGTVTETSFATGDDLVFCGGGTSANTPSGIFLVSYRETFVNGDE